MLTVGLVGAGGMGTVHARHWRGIAETRLLVLDPRPGRAEALEAESAGSLDELLARADVVDVCVPTDLHAEIGHAAIAAGRPTLMEKPLARTVAEGEALVAAAEAAGVLLVPGHVVRFFPAYRRAHDLVRSGSVGTPTVARLRRGGAAPGGAGDWFMRHARSGGVLLDLAIHDFDWLRWTLGEVESVHARSVARGEDGPDYALTTLVHAGGALSHVEATWMDPAGFRTALEVAGTDGLLQFDSRTDDAPLRVARSGASGPSYDPRLAPSSPADPYAQEIRAFLAAARGEAAPVVTARDGLEALRIAELAIRSATAVE